MKKRMSIAWFLCLLIAAVTIGVTACGKKEIESKTKVENKNRIPKHEEKESTEPDKVEDKVEEKVVEKSTIPDTKVPLKSTVTSHPVISDEELPIRKEEDENVLNKEEVRLLKTNNIYIRDPYILPYEGKYYMYAQNFPYGFKVYVSSDLENWEEPVEVIRFPEDFWATKDFWAPEVHIYKGNFYLFATLYSDTANRGTQIFKATSPFGPFECISDGPVTPKEWMCLDGTLYCDRKGTPYMVFCHEWLQIGDGTMCYAQLSDDLSHFVTEPRLMFVASDYPFVKPLEEGTSSYVTDGPFLYRCKNGALLMIWSSFGEKGYFVSVLKSDNDEINGNWIAQKLLFEKDGGHGMIFETFEGVKKLALHYPNSKNEHLKLFELIETNDTFIKREILE